MIKKCTNCRIKEHVENMHYIRDRVTGEIIGYVCDKCHEKNEREATKLEYIMHNKIEKNVPIHWYEKGMILTALQFYIDNWPTPLKEDRLELIYGIRNKLFPLFDEDWQD